MTFLVHLPRRIVALHPEAPHTRPREWLRAAFGASLGFLFSTWLCVQFFGPQTALHFAGPLAASAILLFAVSSGALAQPWSILGSYLCASLVALPVSQLLGHNLSGAGLALGLSLLLMYPLRCLHPPGGALAFCMVFAAPQPGDPAWLSVLPALAGSTGLLGCALLYNNLTRVRYPRQRTVAADTHHTRDALPSERIGISTADLDQALDELGAFVDVTRDDLETIIRSTEKHALQRSMGNIRARQIMSKDVVCASPETPVEQGLHLLTRHHLKALPILDEERRLVGIVSLIDLVGASPPTRSTSLLDLLGWRRDRVLGQLMSSPVSTVDADAHAVELIPLLSDRGLHCLPVLEHGELVGVITQTDLVAALHRDLLAHVG